MREDAVQAEKNVLLQVSPDLLNEMEAAARAENKTPDEWAAEAFARHLEAQKWQKLLTFGQEHSRSQGFEESDVNRLIAEFRAEQTSR